MSEYQKQVSNIQNLQTMFPEVTGNYDIPVLQPFNSEKDVLEWIPFNYALSEKHPAGKGIHFFIDDYQFERIWRNPQKYINKLKQFDVILTPDFSPYADMPEILQIYNLYRKNWVGQFFQKCGFNVIPTIRASRDERSLSWYLDGMPKKSDVAISSMWTNSSADYEYFKQEYLKMRRMLEPSKIYVYGKVYDFMKDDNIVKIETFSERRFNKYGKRQ